MVVWLSHPVLPFCKVLEFFYNPDNHTYDIIWPREMNILSSVVFVVED